MARADRPGAAAFHLLGAVAPLLSLVLLAGCVPLAPVRTEGRVERIWQQAVAAAGYTDRVADLERPDVEWLGECDWCTRRGWCDPIGNVVTVRLHSSRGRQAWGAGDADVLRHEFVHAVLYQTEGLAAMRDEARVRALLGQAPVGRREPRAGRMSLRFGGEQ